MATRRDLERLGGPGRGTIFDGIDRRFDGTFREFRSLLVSVMGVTAVLFAAMMGAVVAAIKI